MFRIDRRLRSASSKFKKLENSAELALAKAQQTATRTLSLRARSRSRHSTGDEQQQQREADGNGNCNGGEAVEPSSSSSSTLLGLLSPRNWSSGGERSAKPATFELGQEQLAEEDEEGWQCGKMNYVEVQRTDTLEGIAAAHDCTVGGLVKLNKLTSRMVFPGQKLLVPATDQQSGTVIANGKPENKPVMKEKNSATMHRGPGHAVQIPPNDRTNSLKNNKKTLLQHNHTSNNSVSSAEQQQQQLSKTQSAPVWGGGGGKSNAELGRMASELDPEDQECLQRFLKIRVKQVTESDGTIVGTLLVTPNCLMFDPDIDHPLVQEKGQDLYGMVANMEDIVSVTVYKHISSLIGGEKKQNKEDDIFDPHRRLSKSVSGGSPQKSVSRQASNGSNSKENSPASAADEEKGTPEKRRQSDARSIPRPKAATAVVAPEEAEDSEMLGYDGDQTLVYGTSAAGLLLSNSLDSSGQSHQQQQQLRTASTGESSLSNSEQQLPAIDEEREIQQQREEDLLLLTEKERRRTVSDMHCREKTSIDELLGKDEAEKGQPPLSSSLDLQSTAEGERQRAHSDLEASKSASLESGGAASGNNHHLRSGEHQRRSPSPSSPFSRYSPGINRKSFGKLGRTLSAKATSIRGTVQSGAQTVASGTQKVAHGVVTHTLSAADHIQTGIQNGAKVVASVPGSIVNVSAGLLQDGQNGVMEVVDSLKEALAEGMDGQHQQQQLGGLAVDQRTPQAMKRERSLATLESLCQRTQQAREQAVQRAFDTGFVLGSEERPAALDTKFSGGCGSNDEDKSNGGDGGGGHVATQDENDRPIGTPPEPPFYMTVRVDRRRRRKKRAFPPTSTAATNSVSVDHHQQPLPAAATAENLAATASATTTDFLDEGCAFGNKRKREFWFAVPRSRVEAIYQFLLQWSPQKYGQVKASTADETNIAAAATAVSAVVDNNNAASSASVTAALGTKGGGNNSNGTGEEEMLSTSATGKQHLGAFVVLDREVDDTLAGEKPSDHFGKLDREWEVVTVRELCRRLSLEDSLEPSEMPLPEGALHSQVLDEFMIRQILDILPPRAEGYPWVNIYNSEKHGFSLSTLYRKMSEWKEEMSPVLLVLRDVAGHVFGAVTSTALRPCDHYYGTGDSCLLFRFTGEYPHTRELRTYNWTGNNQFFVNATRDFLSVGAGGGHYGLWLDADLNNGRSQKCATFDNEPLAGGLDEDFTIQFVEAWGFCMT